LNFKAENRREQKFFSGGFPKEINWKYQADVHRKFVQQIQLDNIVLLGMMVPEFDVISYFHKNVYPVNINLKERENV